MRSFTKFVQFVEKHPHRDIHRFLTGFRDEGGESNDNANAMRRGFQYDYILKIEEEDLTKKLEEIFELAGINLPVGIDSAPMNQNENANHDTTKSTDIVDFYRDAAVEGNITLDELVSTVGRIYRDDIETFGYTFPKSQ